MDEILKAFRELNTEVFKICMLHAIVDASLGALLINLLAMAISSDIGMRIIFVILSGLAIGVIDLHLRCRHFSVYKFEKANPHLLEMLSTARDNLGKHNVVVDRLFEQVINRLRMSSTAKLLGTRQIITKILLLAVLAGSTITFPIYQFSGLTQANNHNNGDDVVFILGNVKLEEDKSIYGNKTEIFIDGEELKLLLSASNININLNQLKEEEKKKFSRENFPTDITAVAAESGEEKIPEDYELIKRYSLKIRGLE